jgi:predicted Zn-dependent protease
MHFSYLAAMQRLPPPDSHRLRAATGWLELGCPEEAQAELDGIQAQHQQHPDVLELRWQLLADAHEWSEAATAARRLVELEPKRVTGWLHHAYALRRAPEGGLEMALEALLPAADRFPAESIVPYNLSCYACQLGRQQEALAWLDRAFKVGDKKELKLMALEDEDLKSLWTEIEKL